MEEDKIKAAIEKAKKLIENMKLEEPYKSLAFQKLLDKFLKASESESIKEPTPIIGDTPQIKSKGCRQAILELLSSNWGNIPRTVDEIKSALEMNALYFPSSTIPATLTQLTKAGKVRRLRKGELFAYVVAKKE